MRVNCRHIKCFLIALFSVFALGGCGAKEPQIKQVFIPVKCNLKMPLRPAESSDFEAHKALMAYFLKCEQIAKDCTQGANE